MSTTKPISTEARLEPGDSAGEYNSSLGRALFQHRIEEVLLSTKKSTGADGVAVSLREGSAFVCRASVGLAPEIGVLVESGQGICGRCIAEAAAVVEQSLEGEIKSVAAVPVMKDGHVYGFVAGFSIEANAFPSSAIEDLQSLAAVIHNEVEPPVAIELNPDLEAEEQDVLSQFGITAPPKSEDAAENFAEEDDSFLSELVRDVLESAPSNQAVSEAMEATEETQGEATPPQPPSFQARSTEEVLMQVVDHLPKPAKPAAAAAASLSPVPKPEKAEKNAPQDVPGSKKQTVAERPVVAPLEKAPAIEPEVSKFHALASDPKIRIAVIVTVGILVIALLAYFLYFRKRLVQEPQKVQASSPTSVAPASQGAPSVPASATESHDTKTDKTPPSTHPAAQKPAKEPLLVAASSLPGRKNVPEEPPPAPIATTSKINAPEIPTGTPDVVFSGARSTGAVPAKLLQRVDPVFPPIARSMHLSGDVRLEAVVGTDGRVKSVRTLDGPNILAVAAADAVKKWRYDPAKQNGKGVESTVEVTIRFR